MHLLNSRGEPVGEGVSHSSHGGLEGSAFVCGRSSFLAHQGAGTGVASPDLDVADTCVGATECVLHAPRCLGSSHGLGPAPCRTRVVSLGLCSAAVVTEPWALASTRHARLASVC